MKQTTFQHPELRDANDNIIQQGAFGKNTALANATNDGWIDYVANDLEALYDNINGARIYVASKAKLPATGDLSAMYIAEDTGKWYLWDGAKYIETDNARKIADEAIAAMDAAKASQSAAKTSEQNAKTSETNAAASEDNAAASEANALSYKNAAAAFATNASNSASSASTTARVLTDIYNEAIASGKIVAPAVDPTLTISGAAADAKATGDNLHNVDRALENEIYGLKDYKFSAVPYIGYYTNPGGVPTLNGGDTQGLTRDWGIILLHVQKGKRITISGCNAKEGTYSVWLNSSSLSDINSIAWRTTSNNGTHECVTDWLAISDHQTEVYFPTMSVTYDYDADITEKVEEIADTVFVGSIPSGSRNLHLMEATAKAGDIIKVRAELVSGTSNKLMIFYNNDTTGHILDYVKYGKDYEFILKDDMTQFDAYLMGTADSVVNITVTVLGKLSTDERYLYNTFGHCSIYKTSFSVAEGTKHSATIDKIYVPVPKGALVDVYIVSSTGQVPPYMVYQYDDAGNDMYIKSTSAVTNDKVLYENAAPLDGASFGMFVTEPAEDTDFTLYVIVKNSTLNNELTKTVESADINLRYSYQKDYVAALLKKPTFLVYTDIHDIWNLFNRIKEFAKSVDYNYIFDNLFLGDLVQDRFEQNPTLFLADDFFKKTLMVLGNHDVWLTGGGWATNAQAYERYFASNISNWGVMQPSGASNNGYCYYYKDYPASYGANTNSLRVIFLDEYHYDETQHNWFVSVLSDARINGLSVVVCSHQQQCISSELTPLSYYAFGCPVGGYDVDPRVDGYAGSYANAYINRRKAVDSFISAGGEFICWMNGHMHRDCCATFEETNGVQLNISLINSSTDTSTKNYINGFSEDTFQYVAFDVVNKYVYIVRIGSSIDRWMHKNQFMLYDYRNHKVIEYK